MGFPTHVVAPFAEFYQFAQYGPYLDKREGRKDEGIHLRERERGKKPPSRADRPTRSLIFFLSTIIFPTFPPGNTHAKSPILRSGE